MKLTTSFFSQPTPIVAQNLLGTLLVHNHQGIVRSGIIVETEAYTFDDPACHAYRGKTERNKSLFGPVGHAYVYFIYGNHYCLNAVAREPDTPAGGVLIRAVEPIDGIEYMQQARGTDNKYNLTNGPGKLTQAFGITRIHDSLALTSDETLFLMPGITITPASIDTTTRIGISQAEERLLRFSLRNNPFVSR